MTTLQTIILGIIQGITEFFPISSSGHLIAIRYLFRFGTDMTASAELVFDIALHFGTLLAICIYFFRDFLTMIKEGFNIKQAKGEDGKINFKKLKHEGKLLWYIVLACIPAGVLGILFDDIIEDKIRAPWIVAISLAVMGIIMYVVDKKFKSETTIKKLTLKQAFLIGIGQTFALIPGFSRSGTTMTAARAMKVDRESAAKFSFLLGAPAMLGAALLAATKLTVEMLNMQFFLGIAVSFVVGLLAIKTLMAIVKKIGFEVFAIYRVVLAVIILITMWVR